MANNGERKIHIDRVISVPCGKKACGCCPLCVNVENGLYCGAFETALTAIKGSWKAYRCFDCLRSEVKP